MKLSIIIFALLFITGLIFPQTGTITGTVTDSATGQSLPGANVWLEGTSLGAATDLNGSFQIKNISALNSRSHAEIQGKPGIKPS